MNTHLFRMLAGVSAGALTLSAQPSQSSATGASPGDASAGSIPTTTVTTDAVPGTGAPSTATGPSSHTAFDPIGQYGTGPAPVRDAGAAPGAGLPTGRVTTPDPLAAPANTAGSSSTLPLGNTSTLSSAPAGTTVTTRPAAPGVSPGTDPIGPTTVTTTTTTQRPPGVAPQPQITRPDPVGVGPEPQLSGPRPIADTSVSTTVMPATRPAGVGPTAPTTNTTTAPTAVAVSMPPPAALPEPIPTAPGSDYVWVRGHYVWSNGQWNWTSGRWELPPQPGMVWVDARFDAQTQRWMPGYWATNTPAPTDR